MLNIKKITNFKELKLIPLNTSTPFDYIISNFPTLILNFSSPNILNIFNSLQHFFSQNSYFDNLKIVCIIPHKIKHYEEYLSFNLPFPIYQLTDKFEIKLEEDLLITNINNSLEFKKYYTNYEISYIFINENQFNIELDNSLKINSSDSFNSSELLKNTSKNFFENFSNSINKDIPIEYSNFIRDFTIKEFRNQYLIISLKNLNNKSSIELNIINPKNLEIQALKKFEFSFLIKSIDILTLDHNNITLIYLLYNNKILIQNYNFNQDILINKIEYEFENEKLRSTDLKKIRININNFITWDHNSIYIFKHNLILLKNSKKLDIKFVFYNSSGQKTKHTSKPTDGIWKQTIWGNINNIQIIDDILLIADSEYSCIRKLDINTGKSSSIYFKEEEKEYEKIKGKISSIYFDLFRYFIVDLDFKRIRILRDKKIKTIFFDEEINLLTQVFFFESMNALVYNSEGDFRILKIFDL